MRWAIHGSPKTHGRLNHGDFLWDFTGKDANYDVDTALKSALNNYKSKIVKIFGDESDDTGDDSGDTGDDSGDTGGDPGETGDVITCDFAGKAPSNSFFSVSGNYSDSKGTATVDGTTYTICLKIESSTSISFTTSAKMKMTLYFGSGDSKVNIKVDGTKVSGDTTTKTLTADLEPGNHKLTKADSCNLFYIKLEK